METMTQNTTTISCYLPFFPGFYESMLSFDYDDLAYWLEEETASTEEEIQEAWEHVDNERYEKDIAGEWVNHFDTLLQETIKTAGIPCPIVIGALDKIDSPREYNFSTDNVDVPVTVNYPALLEWIGANCLESFDAHLKENYSSYDGFMSFIANNAAAFMEEDQDERNTTAVLGFIMSEYGTDNIMASSDNVRWHLIEETLDTFRGDNSSTDYYTKEYTLKE